MNTRRSIPFAFVAVLSLGIAACGDDGDDAGSDTTSAGAFETTATTAAGGTETTSPTTGGDTAPTTGDGTTPDSPATTGGSTPPGTGTGGGGGGGSLTVGSANFPESELLAQIYGQALEAEGYDVSYQLNIGDRTAYYSAIEAGEIDIVPEYTNSLLSFVLAADDETPTATNVEEQLAALDEALPEGLEVLTPSEAEDKDTIVCNQETADEHSLTDLNSLFEVADQITLGAPPEFESRTPFGLAGFEENYGATFAEFVPLDSGAIAAALSAGEIDCGNLFSTNPQISSEGFVSLEDSDAIVPNEAILPLVRSEVVDETVTATLDEVNAALTTENLTEMVGQIVIDAQASDVVAEEFLGSL